MPQARAITNDKGTRQDVKARLANKVNLALEPKHPNPESITVLHLPHNYKELSEPELHFSLVSNKELQHTYKSAYLTEDILYGRVDAQNTKFRVIILKSPVEIPEYVKEASLPITHPTLSLRPLPEDSGPARKAAEEVKREQIIQSLSEKAETTPSKPLVEEVELTQADIVLPDDWQEVPLSVLRTDLLSKGLTPEQTNIYLASLLQVTKRIEPAPEAILEELTVDLPEEFNSWKSNEQYIYLTKDRKLTPEQAHGVIWNSH